MIRIISLVGTALIQASKLLRVGAVLGTVIVARRRLTKH
jgi:hypothetical protein